jgi:orotidine-5'-phosphate decarboxylase
VRPIPILALDTASSDSALSIVDELGDRCRFYKIGGELFTAGGTEVVRRVRHTGAEVFLDLKYHDIPNTVRGAVRAAAALGVRLVTVHALGGSAMIRAAVDAAGDKVQCGILAVTLLTSLAEAEAAALWGRTRDFHAADEVLRLADLAASAGALGIVCSGREAALVKERFGDSLAVLLPGIRLAGAATQDQARVVTPSEAAATGAEYVVVGRAVTAAANRRQAMAAVLEQLGGARDGRGSLA